MPLTRYRFRTSWVIAAPKRDVFAALVDLATYRDWWPDVRAVSQVDDDTARIVCRAALPFSLELCLRRVEEDEPAGRVRVALSGDLVGSLAGRLAPKGPGTRLDIVQHVVANKPLLRALSPVAHPIFRANHALMMRRGLRGLRTRLVCGNPG